MPTKTESALVAVFGNPSDAQAAARELVRNAFAGDRIQIASEAQADDRSADWQGEFLRVGYHDKDIERWLVSIFGPCSKIECQHYAGVVSRGKAAVALSTPHQMVDKAAHILNHHSPITTMLARVAQQRYFV
jgi:hypothetical protein